MDLKDVAEQYFQHEIMVTPAYKKAPYIDNFYNLSEEDTMMADWARADGLNMLCGAASGIIALDIDLIEAKRPELFAEVIKRLPPLFSGRQGNPAKPPTRFFQYNGEAARKFKYIDVEILSDGNNCCMPPGWNYQSNTRFEWAGKSLLEIEKDDLPIMDPSLIEFLDQLNEANRSSEKVKVDFTSEKGRCDHGSHNALSEAGVAMFLEGKSFESMKIAIDKMDKKINSSADAFYFECPSRPEFKRLNRAQAINRFVGEIVYRNAGKKQSLEAEADEYAEFKAFFDNYFVDIRKCPISGMVVDVGRDADEPVLNQADVIQSHAFCMGMKYTRLNMHLARYIEELKPRDLVDLPEWDGKDYIKEICMHVHLKDAEFSVFENYLKFWCAGVFRRMKDSNYQNLFMLLRGKQGLGKDNLIKSMFSDFGIYFSKFSVMPNREIDTWHQCSRHPILHLEEFDQTGKLGMAFLKELITTDHKEYRLPYDRAAKRRRLVGSFISTVNVDNLFRDSTGNRRFAVFDIDHIDWRYPKGNSLQILAQSKALAAENYQLNEDSKAFMAEKIQALTPDSLENEVLEIWNDRLNNKQQYYQKHEFRFVEISEVIRDLQKFSGWQNKTILSFLKRRNASFKRGSNVLYCAAKLDLHKL